MNNLSFEVKHDKVPSHTGNEWENGYFYVIFKDGHKLEEASEYFDTDFRARMAAIGRITLLEKEEK